MLYRALTECIILNVVFQMILITHVAHGVKVSLGMKRMKTRMQAIQSNASLINKHNLYSHLNPENTIITKDFYRKIFKQNPKTSLLSM